MSKTVQRAKHADLIIFFLSSCALLFSFASCSLCSSSKRLKTKANSISTYLTSHQLQQQNHRDTALTSVIINDPQNGPSQELSGTIYLYILEQFTSTFWNNLSDRIQCGLLSKLRMPTGDTPICKCQALFVCLFQYAVFHLFWFPIFANQCKENAIPDPKTPSFRKFISVQPHSNYHSIHISIITVCNYSPYPYIWLSAKRCAWKQDKGGRK